MKRMALFALVLACGLGVFAASTWEGSAVAGGAGDFPSDGMFGACNSFPRDSTVEVKNLENGKSVIVTITKTVDNPGVFIALSPKAAADLGMRPGTASRVRAVALAKTAASAQPSVSKPGESTDPDFNPKLLAPKENLATGSAPAAVPEAPAPIPSTAQADAIPITPAGTIPIAPEGVDLKSTETSESAEAIPALALPSTTGSAPASDSLPSPTESVAVAVAPIVPSAPAIPDMADAVDANRVEAPNASFVPPIPSEPPLPKEASKDSPETLSAVPFAPAAQENSAVDLPVAKIPAEIEESPTTEMPATASGSPSQSVASGTLDSGSISSDPTSVAEGAETAQNGDETGTEVVVGLEPTDLRPPVVPVEIVPEASTDTEERLNTEAAAVTKTEPTLPEAPPASRMNISGFSILASRVRDRIAIVEALEKDAFYIQLAVYATEEALETALTGIKVEYPLTAEVLAREAELLIRLYVGPLGRDEGGVVLAKMRSLGYKDAFVRKGQ